MNVRFIIPIFISIVLGYFFGKLIFREYNEDKETVFNETVTVYFLQQGAYTTKESMDENTKKISSYVYIKDKEYYRVFLGVTKSKETAQKLKDFYEGLGNNIYIKEMSINNINFYNKLDYYENKINNTSDKLEILKICQDLLSDYKEAISF